jgi:hypothetical protein
VKTLDRNRIDGLVLELETGAYRLALALVSEPAPAEEILLEAFASLAPSIARTPGIVELREKLYARIRQRARRQRRSAVMDESSARPVIVSESLHLRIVDLLEEEQAVEPLGRRRAVLFGLIGVGLVGAAIALFRVHSDALAAALPTITALSPAAGAEEVPVGGEVRVTFGRRPAGIPVLRLNPATGKLDSARWEGSTLVADYSGLHLATRYELVLEADYRSSLKDLGHYEKRWTLNTESYPVLVRFVPADGQTTVTRIGAVAIDFTHRPPVDPQVTIVPADGTLDPGHWTGETWTIGYSGLKAVTTYQVTAVVNLGVAAANIRRQWTFSTEPGAPPPGMPVIWYGTRSPSAPPSDTQRVVAVDWHGNLAGTMYVTAFGVQQAPDGSGLFTQDGSYLDRNGVASASGNPYASMMADNSQSVCTLGYPGGVVGSGQLWLFAGPIRGPMRRVAPVGSVGARSGIGLIACSVASDRAVVADNGVGGTTGIHVIVLSTGRVLYQRSYDGLGFGIVSSRDGRYLAEQMPTYDAQGQPLAAVTLIRRIADGRVVARVDKQRILQFSWDSKRVVTAPFFMGMGPNEIALLDWQTGKILWRQPADPAIGGVRPVYAMAEPNGPAMAIAVGSQPTNGNVDELWLVAADGQATQVVSGVFYPAFNGGF